MKFFAAAVSLCSIVHAAIVPRSANYDGYQVVRLEVGDNLARVQSLIRTLSLSTWNGGPQKESTVDVVIPTDVTGEFNARVQDLNPQIMHDDLGASIAQETAYPVYRRK